MLAIVAIMAGDQAAEARAYRITDRFRVESFGSPSFAPDGTALLFTRRRPLSVQPTSSLEIEETRQDVWLQASPAADPVNLTNGGSDASGWWAPLWSPDGARVAMLSNRGGRVGLWGWDRQSRALRPIAAPAIDYQYRRNNSGFDQACQWVDARRLVCLIVPDREPGPALGGGSYRTGRWIEQAESAWTRARSGRRTAHEVDSLSFPMPRRALTMIDFDTGRQQMIASTQAGPFVAAGERTFWISGQAAAVAFINAGFVSAFPDRVRTRMGYPADLGVAGLDGGAIALDRALPRNVVTQSISWSPGGDELAFFALEDRHIHPELLFGEAASSVRYPAVGSRDYPGAFFRVEVQTGRVERLHTGEIDLGSAALPPRFIWLPTGEIAFFATLLSERANPAMPAAPRWIVLQRDGRTRPLLGGNAAGGRIVATEIGGGEASVSTVDGRKALLALYGGDVWRVDPATGATSNLTAGVAPPVVRVDRTDADGGSSSVILTVDRSPEGGGGQSAALTDPTAAAEHLLLDTRTGAAIPICSPHRNAVLAAFSPEGSSILFQADRRDGSFLWRAERGGALRQIAEANRYWGSLTAFEERVIDYTGLNGERLRARLTLPVGYRSDRRYPIVIDSDLDQTPWRRPGNFAPNEPDRIGDRIDSHAAAFAAAGYIHVWASMPTTTGMDQAGRGNLLSFTQGLLPAVDALVAQGYADPDRLFLFGFSSMALGVYGTVTQTSRFRAAVGAFGWVDHGTKQLSLNMRARYSETPFTGGDFLALYLDGDLRAWRDGDILRRNSPLTYVDRVQTPLMIIDSDFDAGWMENSEMFYSALVQQRKPARFVRYFGEGHGLGSPANILDMYQRIFAWFDQWGDIARDSRGAMIFEGPRVRAHGNAEPISAENYRAFEIFRSADE